MVGNNVSHSNAVQNVRLMLIYLPKIYYVEQDCWISLTISAAGLRTINKRFDADC